MLSAWLYLDEMQAFAIVEYHPLPEGVFTIVDVTERHEVRPGARQCLERMRNSGTCRALIGERIER